jgi:hypothetical protein
VKSKISDKHIGNLIFSPSNEAKSAPGTKLNRDREDDEEAGEEENTGFTSFLASWLGDE